MMVWLALALAAAVQGDGSTPGNSDASLRGSPAAMQEQNRIALEHGLDFYQTEEEILAAVSRGDLVEASGDPLYQVADFVTLPYMHEAARLFVERTAALYREACGDTLVVTSGVRAIAEQPPNAHALSVHPAGMAVDLRVSQNPECREWIEDRFLTLEERGVINATHERNPPHYHVAVYPEPYLAFAEANPVPIAPEPEAEAGPEIEHVEQTGRRTMLVLLVLAALAAGAVWFLIRRAPRRGSPPPD